MTCLSAASVSGGLCLITSRHVPACRRAGRGGRRARHRGGGRALDGRRGRAAAVGRGAAVASWARRDDRRGVDRAVAARARARGRRRVVRPSPWWSSPCAVVVVAPFAVVVVAPLPVVVVVDRDAAARSSTGYVPDAPGGTAARRSRRRGARPWPRSFTPGRSTTIVLPWRCTSGSAMPRPSTRLRMIVDRGVERRAGRSPSPGRARSRCRPGGRGRAPGRLVAEDGRENVPTITHDRDDQQDDLAAHGSVRLRSLRRGRRRLCGAARVRCAGRSRPGDVDHGAGRDLEIGVGVAEARDPRRRCRSSSAPRRPLGAGSAAGAPRRSAAAAGATAAGRWRPP